MTWLSSIWNIFLVTFLVMDDAISFIFLVCLFSFKETLWCGYHLILWSHRWKFNTKFFTYIFDVIYDFFRRSKRWWSFFLYLVRCILISIPILSWLVKIVHPFVRLRLCRGVSCCSVEIFWSTPNPLSATLSSRYRSTSLTWLFVVASLVKLFLSYILGTYIWFTLLRVIITDAFVHFTKVLCISLWPIFPWFTAWWIWHDAKEVGIAIILLIVIAHFYSK